MAEEQHHARRRHVREVSIRESQPKLGQQNSVPTTEQHCIEEVRKELKELKELKEKLKGLQRRKADSYHSTPGCWHCAKEGHYRHQCPQLHPQNSNLN